MIEILAWVFIVIILFIFAIILDMLLDIYSDRNRDGCLELKVSQFKKFYSINLLIPENTTYGTTL